MSPRDGLALAISAGYLVVVLFGSSLLSARGLSRRTVRALVHLAVGGWILPTVLLFEGRFWAMLLPMLFVLANALRRPRGLYRALEGNERIDWGLVLYPAGVAGAIGFWWSAGTRPAVVGGVLVMAVADRSAALVGSRWGRHRWRRLLRIGAGGGGGKTVEGSAAAFLSAAVIITGVLMVGAGWRLVDAGIGGLAVGAAAAGVEALSPGQLDNLTLPLAAGALTHLALLVGGVR